MSNKLLLTVAFAGTDKLSGALKNIIGLGKTGSTVLRDMKGEAGRLGRELENVRKQIAAGSGNLTTLVDRERQLARETAEANMALAAQRDHLARIGRIQELSGAMAARGAGLTAAGQGNMAGGAVMGAGVALLARGAMDFDAAMTDIGIKLGINQQLTRQLGAEVIRAAQESNQLPANMLLGADALASAGIAAKAIPPMLDDIGKIAVAANADISDLAKTSASNMINLKISATETGQALAIMHAAGKAGRFELKTMAQYFPALSARAQAFGQTGPKAVADLAAAAQVAAKAVGGDGEQAATNLENLLAKINMEETRQKFGKMGVDLQAEMTKAMQRGLTPLEAITTITDQTLKKNGGLQNLTLLFGDMQAQNALLPLIQNFEEFRRIRQQALDDAPQAMLDFARKSSDAKIQLQALMGAGQGAGIMLGRELLPHLVEAGGHLLGIVKGVTGWMREHPKLTSAIMTGLVYLTAFKLGLGALQFAFGGILTHGATALNLFLRFRAWGGITGIVMRLAGALPLLGKAFALMTGPIGLTVMAIGLLGYAVYSNWDRIKAAFGNGWAAVKGVLSAAPGWLKSIGSMMMQGLLMALNPVLLAVRLVQIAKAGVTAFKNYFGIKSPSRLMMAMGGHVAGGLALGLDRNAAGPLRSMSRLAAGVGGAAALGLATPALAGGPDAIGPGGPRGGPAPASVVYNVTIRIDGAGGGNPRELAQEIKRELDALLAIDARGAYTDA